MAHLLWFGEIGFAYLVSSFVVAVIVGRFLRNASLDPAQFEAPECSGDYAGDILARVRLRPARRDTSSGAALGRTHVAARVMHDS